MSRQSTRQSTQQSAATAHVFSDDEGRLWSVVRTASAVVFTCISDARQSARALAIEDALREEQTGDDTLRAWLRAAPKIGSLS
jgi:hypothetical protein